MKKFKKFLFTVASMGAVLAPVALAVSCGSSSSSSSSNLPQSYIKPADRVTKIITNSNFTPEVAKSNPQKMIVITDSGKVNDKSFNESQWEALLDIYDQSKGNVQVAETEPSRGKFDLAYNSALQNGYTVWVLSGFTHQSFLQTWLKNPSNVAALKRNHVKIICVDFSVPNTEYSDVYSLRFDVQDAAYIGGQVIANFLADEYPGDSNKANRIVGTFGGAVATPVTDYILGLEKGIYDYNQTAAAGNLTQVNPNSNTVPLDSGFVVNSKMDQTINTVLSENPSVVFPVAGPATGRVLQTLTNNKNTTTNLIGVDVDQSLSYSDNADRFDFSIVKNMAQAVYDVVLASVYGMDPKGLLANNPTHQLQKGIESDWVNVSVSHVANQAQRTKLDQLINQYTSAFMKLSSDQINTIRAYKMNASDTASTDYATFLNNLTKMINAQKGTSNN